MNEDEFPPGFQLPLFRALTEQDLMSGVPRKVMVLNGMMFLILVFVLHSWWIIPLNILVHLGAMALTKQDEQFFDCFSRYVKKKNYYGT